MIEPEEDEFDYSELDKVIAGARAHDIHLVLPWFGSFKNALSTYVPGWVKRDVKRLPRVHIAEAGGVMNTLELISPFNDRACTADAKAFATLMQHLKEVDGEHHTVPMVQVENETGLLGDSRDRSKTANEKFKQPVPKEIISYFQKSSNLHPEFRKRFPEFRSHEAGNVAWAKAFPAVSEGGEAF